MLNEIQEAGQGNPAALVSKVLSVGMSMSKLAESPTFQSAQQQQQSNTTLSAILREPEQQQVQEQQQQAQEQPNNSNYPRPGGSM